MTTKTISVRVEPDEHAALAERAKEAGLSLGEFVLESCRTGLSLNMLHDIQELEHTRHLVARQETRALLMLTAQTTLLVQQLAGKAGVDLDDAIATAKEVTTDTLREGDELEALVAGALEAV